MRYQKSMKNGDLNLRIEKDDEEYKVSWIEKGILSEAKSYCTGGDEQSHLEDAISTRQAMMEAYLNRKERDRINERKFNFQIEATVEYGFHFEKKAKSIVVKDVIELHLSINRNLIKQVEDYCTEKIEGEDDSRIVYEVELTFLSRTHLPLTKEIKSEVRAKN